MTTNKTVRLEITIDQAKAIAEAMDVYSRLGIGQFNAVHNLVVDGTIPTYAGMDNKERKIADGDACHEINLKLAEIASMLGFSRGQSLGISNRHVDIKVQRAWEVKKMLDQALAFENNPNPSFKGVNYDGLPIRYTNEEAPKVNIS